MRWSYSPDEGWGSNTEFGIGWLTLTFSRYEDHWYFQIYWMRPK